MSVKTSFAASLALVFLSGLATAQSHTLAPASGTLNLDPASGAQRFDISIAMGGDIEANSLGDECRGDITDAPGMRLHYAAGGEELRFLVTSTTDTSLIIRTPEGEWLCNDDYGSHWDPYIRLTSPPEGQYDVWTGLVSPWWGEAVAAESELTIINLTEASDNVMDLPMIGPIALDPGFQPTEFNVRASADGSIRAPAWNIQCGADADDAPTMRLIYGGVGAGLKIAVQRQQAELTLLVRTPDRGFVCNDELYSSVFAEIESAAAGEYEIWVGQASFDRDVRIPVLLTISEF